MRFMALAVDYDGTLATNGTVAEETVAALERLTATGRKLLLVTGRELPDLLEIFPRIDLFERVIAENGALLYTPKTRESRLIAPQPPPAFAQELVRRGCDPVSTGGSIVATVQPHETVVLDVIREMGLEMHVIFNKGAVMVLPSGVNKASGLAVALEELGLSPHNVIAMGDGENDHALLSSAEIGVAVANAVPMLCEAADHVTAIRNGAGVREVVDALLADDLQQIASASARRLISLGKREDESEVRIIPYGAAVLAAGTSGSGKSTFVSGVVEQLIEQQYQCCIIDPEGDYENFVDVMTLGDPKRAPSAPEVIQALEKSSTSLAVNLLGVKLEDRPAYFLELFTHLQEMRSRTGRPHWIVVDEAHHVLPADRPAPPVVQSKFPSIAYVTVEPATVHAEVLQHVDIAVALGDQPGDTLRELCKAIGGRVKAGDVKLESGQALLWLMHSDESPFVVKVPPSKAERRRHVRKYAQGELAKDNSFYFRGPGNKLKLRAQNLHLFVQIGEGVDDDTWLHHLQHGDYSEWMETHIKDPQLAEEVRAVETDDALSPEESRARIKEAVERHYTLPAAAATQ